jgi:hypothetical protein
MSMRTGAHRALPQAFPQSLAAEHGLDPRGKLVPGEGLGYIVVGAEPKPGRPVGFGAGRHDHRHIRPLAHFGGS